MRGLRGGAPRRRGSVRPRMRAGTRGSPSPKNIIGASSMENGETTIKKSFIVQILQTNAVTSEERK